MEHGLHDVNCTGYLSSCWLDYRLWTFICVATSAGIILKALLFRAPRLLYESVVYVGLYVRNSIHRAIINTHPYGIRSRIGIKVASKCPCGQCLRGINFYCAIV